MTKEAKGYWWCKMAYASYPCGDVDSYIRTLRECNMHGFRDLSFSRDETYRKLEAISAFLE